SGLTAGNALVAARPVLIAQISDLHITPPGTFAYGCVDTAAALTAAIDTLNRFSPRPDLVVISGDVAYAALPEEYQHATKLLRALHIPFAAIPGNHDRRSAIREAFPDPAYGAADSALNSMRRVGELDILLIDSTCQTPCMANSIRQRWGGSKRHSPPRRRGPRSCFCTTRPSTQASYPPMKCG
ncbi:MAG: metallophosphoesterase, partial [Pseudolabrys sp.]